MYGESAYLQALEPQSWAAIRVDGVSKAMRRSLVDTLRAMSVREPGLDLSNADWKVA